MLEKARESEANSFSLKRFHDLILAEGAIPPNLIAKKLGFSAVSYEYGSFFHKGDLATGAQIDLLFKRADKVITLCEIKFQERVGKKVIAEVERKASALSAFGSYSIEKVLISAFPPSQDLLEEGYFAQILTTDDLAAG